MFFYEARSARPAPVGFQDLLPLAKAAGGWCVQLQQDSPLSHSGRQCSSWASRVSRPVASSKGSRRLVCPASAGQSPVAQRQAVLVLRQIRSPLTKVVGRVNPLSHSGRQCEARRDSRECIFGEPFRPVSEPVRAFLRPVGSYCCRVRYAI